jgi:hypothetical protein
MTERQLWSIAFKISTCAIEWELARLDPETYGRKSGGVVATVNPQTNLDGKPSLVEVLKRIGAMPDVMTRAALERRESREGLASETTATPTE